VSKKYDFIKHNKPTSNNYVYAGRSNIHNKGLFARRDIETETILCEYDGPRLSRQEGEALAKEGNVYIFGESPKSCIDGSVSWNLARYANHSCCPNSKSQKINGRIFLKAIKPILKGEEITYDYGYSFKNFNDNPCNCGKPDCVGFIVPQKFKSKIK